MSGEFPISSPMPGGPAVLWGGALPAGSLKYLTFSRYLARVPPGVRGLVDLSGSSTALALDVLGRARGLPTLALTDASGAAHLYARGFAGEVRTVSHLAEAMALCQRLEREGWCWPRQLVNPALVECVEVWASRLLEVVRTTLPGVRHVVCGFGTGATLVGLHRVFVPAGYGITGLQCTPSRSLPGWRNYEAQNLGEEDLFFPFQAAIPLETAPQAASSCLEALLHHARAGARPGQVLVISHDGRPSPTVRAGPVQGRTRRPFRPPGPGGGRR